MKKILLSIACLMLLLTVTACGTTTDSRDEDGNPTRDFRVGQTATINDINIIINSVTRVEYECAFESRGECQRYNEPDNDFFLVLDITITNNSDNDLLVAASLDFSFRNQEGETARMPLSLNAITSRLGGTVLPGDPLRGQIAFDVVDSEGFIMLYRPNLLDDPIRFEITADDIQLPE